MTKADSLENKRCAACGQQKAVTAFQRRTGRKSGANSQRGICKSCARRKNKTVSAAEPLEDLIPAASEAKPKLKRSASAARNTARASASRPVADPFDASALRATHQGVIRMRGRTDKGRRWHQEIDLELAVTLVKERAAVLVNRHTIRRLYSNKEFRQLILTRDKHTCHYCGQYGDTIDHLLPRAKGGHTTPDNCVCACNECNQSKADRDFEEFVGSGSAQG